VEATEWAPELHPQLCVFNGHVQHGLADADVVGADKHSAATVLVCQRRFRSVAGVQQRRWRHHHIV
jgi:hypothetical protein